MPKPRVPMLLDAEGWYECEKPSIPISWQAMYNGYLASGTKRKFTRYLASLPPDVQASFPEPLTELGKKLTHVKFKVSCRVKDIERMSATHHFKSCLAGKIGYDSNNVQRKLYSENPNVALVYASDKSGKFKSRYIIRAVYDAFQKPGVVIYPPYGCAIPGIITELEKIFPQVLFPYASKLGSGFNLKNMLIAREMDENYPHAGLMKWEDISMSSRQDFITRRNKGKQTTVFQTFEGILYYKSQISEIRKVWE